MVVVLNVIYLLGKRGVEKHLSTQFPNNPPFLLIEAKKGSLDTKVMKHALNLSRRNLLEAQCTDHHRNSNNNISPEIEAGDLESLTIEPTIALGLPKLPSVFNNTECQPVSVQGLVKSDIEISSRQNDLTAGSFEPLTTEKVIEEKIIMDNSLSEKSFIKQHQSLRLSSIWNAGDTMATTSDIRMNMFGINQGSEEIIEEGKFAEIAEKFNDTNLLDDETSPTDSLASNASVDLTRNNKGEKLSDWFKESNLKNLEDISPEIEVCSFLTIDSPTHASISFSLSDVEDNFLIDDEIADQPGLLCNDDSLATSKDNFTHILQEDNSKYSIYRSKDSSALASNCKVLNKISRSGSLDSLSPCESITLDNIMLDFESSSSLNLNERLYFMLLFILIVL